MQWMETVRSELRQLWRAGGWAYRDGSAPATEPTVLAAMALWGEERQTPGTREIVRDSSHWLASIQQADGGLGVNADLPEPAWPTAWALLLWSVLRETSPASRAARWLLTHQGACFSKSAGSALGHDTTIPGWSWVLGTHSWLEPTALAVIALKRSGYGEHNRVQQGLDLIRDRAIPDGGWNFGNNIVFGSCLRPKPGPTSLALLALSGVEPRTSHVDKSIAYLQGQLKHVRSAQSLGLGLLALTAWSEDCPQALEWLEEAHTLVVGRSDRAAQLAYLLLASSPRTLDLLGLPAGKGAAHE